MRPTKAEGGIDLRHAAIGVLRLDDDHHRPDFGQERVFQPADPTQRIAWVLIGAGWLPATPLAAGITRLHSRQWLSGTARADTRSAEA